MRNRIRALAAAIVLGTASGAAMGLPPLTTAERSGFAQTGRYAEVQELCRAYAESWPQAVRCVEFGRSPEGRPLLALVASRSGALLPEDARRRHIPVLLVQGGIHAGEIDGKDAGFMALRELLAQAPANDPLQRLVLVFVPVFNVDGHERFGRWNRPNQTGPEEMGWRTTAQNLNLNRDYMKADAPEMRAMLRLLERWDPIVYADLHVTDGANFRHDVSIQVEPLYTGDSGLRAEGSRLSGAVREQLRAQGSLPLDFYPDFVRNDDPASGFAVVPAPPRFSHAYWSQHNRFGILVETHSWKPYAHRVDTTRRTLLALAGITASDGPRWLELAQAADAAAARLGGQQLVLAYQPGEHESVVEFQGYAYTREPSAISGALWTRYDTTTPQVLRLPLKDAPQAALSVRVPQAGYLVPAAFADAVAVQLALHGIAFERLPRALDAVAVQAFRATEVHYAKESLEGRAPVELVGAWHAQTRSLAPGALFVPIAQPAARIVVALLDPQGPDSLSAWGSFNATLEAKEYMEPYVAEVVAREQLANDPALAKEFAQRLAQDAAFAASPEARLEFFYQHHPSYDERLRLYPILAVDQVPAGH